MASLAGKYQHTENENLEAYLESLGVGQELIQKAVQTSTTFEITIDGNNGSLKGRNSVTFKFGEEYDEPMPGGIVLKSITTIEGDKIVTKSTTPDGRKGTRTIEKTADGISLVLSSEQSSVTAKRLYKKL